MRTLFITLVLSFFLGSCEKIFPMNEVVTGCGTIQTDERTLKSFTTIESRIGANINVHPSEVYFVKVTANQNLLRCIHTSVINSSLIITTGGYQLHSDSTITIDVYTPCLEAIRHKGAGRVSSSLPVPEITMSGSGCIVCTGASKSAHVILSGSGDVNLLGMPVNTAYIELRGTGNIKIDAREYLDISIAGIGSVFYKGSPEINRQISGIGNVISIN